MSFPRPALDRLAQSIRRGEAVFFVGAGFSIDSEGNSAVRLVRRLLIRLIAVTDASVAADLEGYADTANELRESFYRTFWVALSDKSPYVNAGQETSSNRYIDIRQLAGKYYEVNEWFCQTFAVLLRNHRLFGNTEVDAKATIRRISVREEEIRRTWTDSSGKPFESVSLREIHFSLIKWAQARQNERAPGKALFLDTLGFRCEDIMRGGLWEHAQPQKQTVVDDEGTLSVPRNRLPVFQNVDRAESRFFGRILPRHRVLARFAREGWCGTTITTNYDFLLDGAYRLAGFQVPGVEDPFPRSYYSHFRRIGSPLDFITTSGIVRAPALVKMHGCAEVYRHHLEDDFLEDDGEDARSYLQSMVFTYREIQNWRQDAWAADYLRTQLRTRTVVFCGYSLTDPVIHDTFRTVYEDMERIRRPYLEAQERAVADQPSPAASEREPDDIKTPAFFFAYGDDNQFHALEVLRAASKAVNERAPELTPHPNYIRFEQRGVGFPDIDSLLCWTNHRAVRFYQTEVLKESIQSTAVAWLGKPRTRYEYRTLQDAFDKLCQREAMDADQWPVTKAGGHLARRECERTVAWTERFHSGLLREFSFGEVVGRPRASQDIARLRRSDWHYPFTENQAWTGWGVIVELALRNVAQALGSSSPVVADALVPTVLLRFEDRRMQHSVTIHYPAFSTRRGASSIGDTVHDRTYWELGSGATWSKETEVQPWNATRTRRGVYRTVVPAAEIVWNWALGKNLEDARQWIQKPAKPRSNA